MYRKEGADAPESTTSLAQRPARARKSSWMPISLLLQVTCTLTLSFTFSKSSSSAKYSRMNCTGSYSAPLRSQAMILHVNELSQRRHVT